MLSAASYRNPQANEGVEYEEIPLTLSEQKFYDRKGDMLLRAFKWNVGHISIMWSLSLFNTFLLHLQLKYLNGNIFENSNYCGASEVFAVVFGGIIYNFMGGLIPTYFLASSISIFGSLGILYQENHLDEIHLLFIKGRLAFYRRMPSLIFIAKFGVAMSLLATQLASLTDGRLFPKEKRAVAVSFCSLIAYSATLLAPLINELEEVTPVVVFILLILLSFLNTAV